MDDMISRSEAIRIASGYCHWSNIPAELAKLPSVTPAQNVCEDAISRQQCIDAVNKIVARYVPKIYIYTLSLELEKAITDLPFVSTEKTGRWELVQYDSNPNIGNWHCSECNRIVCGAITAANPVYTYKYCPECGARMGVEE